MNRPAKCCTLLLSRILPFITALALPASAAAIERYALEPLPGAGFGGSVRGFFLGAGATAGEVAGEIVRGDGSGAAVVWSRDVNGDWAATLLPDDGYGSSARAAGYIGETEKNLGVVGFKAGAELSAVATMWRQDSAGNWTVETLPTPAGLESFANALHFAPLKPAEFVVGTIRGELGDRAVLWQRSTGNWDMVLLPTLGGTNGEAQGLKGNDKGLQAIIGRAQRADGTWHATVWRRVNRPDFGAGWRAIDLGALGNGQSVANNIGTAGVGAFFAVGETTFVNGRTRATGWCRAGAKRGILDLGVLEGLANSSANAIQTPFRQLGGADTPTRVIGTSWNDTTDLTGTVWNGLFGIFPAVALMPEVGWSVGTLSAIAPDGAMGGQAYDTSISTPVPQAMVMVPTTTHMPDEGVVRQGKLVKRACASSVPCIANAWWADGRALVVAARRANGQEPAVIVDFRFSLFSQPTSPTRIVIDVIGAGVTKGGAGIQLVQDLQLFNFAQNQWVSLGVGQLDTTPSAQHVELSQGISDYINTDELWIGMRLVVSGQSAGKWALGVDEITAELDLWN